ncbi:MAG: hypothetical protein B7C55_03175 [Actinomycetales bacterium mxb001]|nr:MAG: hypothetical protein B7C55_03175 [Actinomycetales bacterium mxb001]
MSTVPEHPAGGGSAMDRILADPALRSRDDDGVAAIAIGTALWTIALVALALFGNSITGIDIDRWILVCAIGAGLGIPGLAIVLARRARLRRRSA